MTAKGAPCQPVPGTDREWAETDYSNCDLPLHPALSSPTRKARAGGYAACRLPGLWEAVFQRLLHVGIERFHQDMV